MIFPRINQGANVAPEKNLRFRYKKWLAAASFSWTAVVTVGCYHPSIIFGAVSTQAILAQRANISKSTASVFGKAR
jgi:hypothetical protein